jgi:hypothetical protein
MESPTIHKFAIPVRGPRALQSEVWGKPPTMPWDWRVKVSNVTGVPGSLLYFPDPHDHSIKVLKHLVTTLTSERVFLKFPSGDHFSGGEQQIQRWFRKQETAGQSP